MKLTLSSIIKTSLSLGLGCFLFWYFFHQMNGEEKKEFFWILTHANYRWILLSLALSFVTFIIRAERWKLTLEPLGYATQFSTRYHSLMIGYLINFTVPRAGEFTRAALLSQKEKTSFSSTFGTILSERVIDVLFLGTIGAITYLTNTTHFLTIYEAIKDTFQPENASQWANYLYFGGLVIFCLLILIYLFNKRIKEKVNAFISDLYQGVLSILKMEKKGLYFFYSFLIWSLYIVHFGICFLSIPETSSSPFSTILLAFIAGSLGIVLTNGGIGSFPLLIGLTLSIVDTTHENANVIGNSLGMLIWSSETFLVILLGVISFISFKRKK